MWRYAPRTIALLTASCIVCSASVAKSQTELQNIRSAKPSEASALQIYIAGPLGFSEAGRSFYYRTLVPRVRRLADQVYDPWKLTEQRKIDAVLNLPYGEKKRRAWRRLNMEIGHNNRTAIDKSNVVFAILDGTDVDSGTAAEIGYAFAKGKTIVGYRGDFRLSADNEGSKVNLQVEYFIRESGGDIIGRLSDLPDALAKVREHLRRR
jgi:nucleoside 2-deoxyribosyltransferase